MATYHVKGPDGHEYELNGPEGATDEQVIAKAKEAFGHQDDLAKSIRANDKGLQDVSISDAVTAPFQVADTGGELAAEKLGAAGHPIAGAAVGTAVQMAPYIPAAVSGIRAAGAIGDSVMSKAGSIRNGLADWFKKKAEEQAVKSIAPTGTNLEQMGEASGEGAEGVRQAGRYMLDKKIVKPYADAEEMSKTIAPLNQAAGKTVGEFRDTGDLRSLAQGVERPSSLDIEKAIREKLATKYGPGAEAGQGGELENAINEVRKLAPVNTSTTGSEMAQTMENLGGEGADSYQAARAAQETQPEMTDGFPYLHDKPTYTDLAGTATKLNDVAKNARQINQPSGALTDAANVLSQKSTEGLEGLLSPTEQQTFGAAKREFGLTSNLQKIADRSQYRDLSTGNALPVSHFGAVSRGVNAVAPASVRATVADKISNALRTNPQAFGRNGQVLQRAMQTGKASLNSVIYMLQQQDPEFKKQFEQMNRGE